MSFFIEVSNIKVLYIGYFTVLVYWTVSSIPVHVLWEYGIDYLEFSQKKLIEKSLIIGEKDFVGSRYEVWRLIN